MKVIRRQSVEENGLESLETVQKQQCYFDYFEFRKNGFAFLCLHPIPFNHCHYCLILMLRCNISAIITHFPTILIDWTLDDVFFICLFIHNCFSAIPQFLRRVELQNKVQSLTQEQFIHWKVKIFEHIFVGLFIVGICGRMLLFTLPTLSSRAHTCQSDPIPNRFQESKIPRNHSKMSKVTDCKLIPAYFWMNICLKFS